jgi:hypothetical protein
MNNKRFILIKNLAILIVILILFVFAYAIVVQSPIERSSFPEWQPFTEQQKINITGSNSVGAGFFFLSHEQNPNWLGYGIEFFSFVSIDRQPITNEKTDQTGNEGNSNCYEYMINHFQILFLIGLVSFLIGLFIGFHSR